MRTINATLLTEQKKHSYEPTYRFVLTNGSGSSTHYTRLVGYTYREIANQTIASEIVLDNSAGYFESYPVLLGDEVVISRGCRIDGVRYLEALPTLYVESLEYGFSLLTVHLTDFWGKLRRFRQAATYRFSSTTVQDIIDDILDAVGLTRSGTVTSLTVNFTITRNERYDLAFRRVCSMIPDYPYAGPGEVVKFKTLSGSDSADYTFDWNTQHPVREMVYTESAWKYNKITVVGSLGENGTEPTGTAQSAAQQALVGVRQLTIRDPVLRTDEQCLARANAELAFYEAAATQVELEALPCHGLEIYDMVGTVSRPGGGSGVKSRVKSYIERYGPGEHNQEIRLLPPSSDIHIEPAEIPDWFIAQDDEASAKVGPAALNGLHAIGADVRGD